MSVFSTIRKGRSQARELKEKRAEQDKKDKELHVPYRHVPTHAAADALANAPPSWRVDDREKIVEQNRRRSAMAASGLNMRMPGPPRIASSLSQVSFPAAHANPVGNLPRAYSYTGVPPVPGWSEHNGEPLHSPAVSLKGKEVERPFMVDSGRTSAMSGKGSPAGSSGDSTSSQDDLEMRQSFHRHSMMASPTTGIKSHHQTTSHRPAHRLHPSSRRGSDASDRGDITAVRKAAVTTNDRRPPPAMITQGYNSMPTAPSLELELPGALSSPETTSSSPFASFDFGTISPLTTSPTSVSMRPASNSNPATPAAVTASEVPPWETITLSAPVQVQLQTQTQSPLAKQQDRKLSKPKVTRFLELETIDTARERPGFRNDQLPVTTTTISAARYEPTRKPSFDTTERRISETYEPEPSAVKSGKRLSKQKTSGGKLQKKTRRSMFGSAVAVS